MECSRGAPGTRKYHPTRAPAFKCIIYFWNYFYTGRVAWRVPGGPREHEHTTLPAPPPFNWIKLKPKYWMKLNILLKFKHHLLPNIVEYIIILLVLTCWIKWLFRNFNFRKKINFWGGLSGIYSKMGGAKNFNLYISTLLQQLYNMPIFVFC